MSFRELLRLVPSVPHMPFAAAAPSVGPSVAERGASAVSDAPSAYLVSLIDPFTPDALANGFATLVGALLGAMLAYALQRRFQRSIEFKNDLTAAHRLMFALLQQINTIVLLQRDYVYGELKNPGRFLSIPATPPFDTSKNVLQLPELAFLLSSKKGRTILYDFYLAQENYIEALNQWNIRSLLHLEKVQPALASAGISNGSELTVADLKRALGMHTYGSIVNSTENCIGSLRRAFQRLVAVKAKARPYLVTRFRSSDFTEFDLPEKYGLDDNPEALP